MHLCLAKRSPEEESCAHLMAWDLTHCSLPAFDSRPNLLGSHSASRHCTPNFWHTATRLTKSPLQRVRFSKIVVCILMSFVSLHFPASSARRGHPCSSCTFEVGLSLSHSAQAGASTAALLKVCAGWDILEMCAVSATARPPLKWPIKSKSSWVCIAHRSIGYNLPSMMLRTSGLQKLRNPLNAEQLLDGVGGGRQGFGTSSRSPAFC